MTPFIQALLDIYKALVSMGLAPLDIGLIFAIALLYKKAEELDAALHACLDESVSQKIDREIQDKVDRG